MCKKMIKKHILNWVMTVRRIFEGIGILSLLCFSFFYTKQISTVIKENDDIMKQIKEIEPQYKIEAKDALINEDTIIPGLSGSEIDVKKSYQKMKKTGSFNANLFVYKDVEPKVKLQGNYDKYIISGNTLKKEVSLVFLVDNKDNINKIVDTLNNRDLEATFFIDGYWFEQNNNQIIDLIEDGHIVGNYGYNKDYEASGVAWMDTIVTKIGKQKQTYCISFDKNESILKRCALNHSYTLIPTIVGEDSPYSNIKQNLRNGSIIALEVNENTMKELPIILDYIGSKDLEIVNITRLLEE